MDLAEQNSDRILVAVSHSPFSGRLIEAGYRIARGLSARWVAINVDTGESLTAADRLQLDRNIELARSLGAEIVTLADFDLAHAIQYIARQKDVSQIIVGRPARKRLQELFKGGSFLDRLVREAKDIDVLVLRENTPAPAMTRVRPRLRLNWDRSISYWNTLWFLLGLSALNRALLPIIEYRAVGFIFLLGVFLVGVFGALRPVLFAAAFSALVWDYFFIPPRHAFTISEPDDILMLVMYFVAASIIGVLANRSKRQQVILRERENRSAVLYEAVSAMATIDNREKMLSRVTTIIGAHLDGYCQVIVAKDPVTLEPAALAGERHLTEKAFTSGAPVGWMSEVEPNADSLHIPLRGLNEPTGVLIYTPREKRRLSRDQLGLLYTLSSQLSISLEREILAARAKNAARLIESEKLHQTLLNSISHELRTPLTAIIGCASALDDAGVLAHEDRRRELLNELLLSGNRLNRVVENLLDMTRLNAGMLMLKRDWYEVNDIIGVSLGKVRSLLGNHPIQTRIEPQLPLISIDMRLMEHAISNLVLNAATYSPEGSQIEIQAESGPSSISISVRDFGPGIPAEDLEHIFEKFYRVPGSPPGGTGLGLSIAQSIVELHGGKLKAILADGKGTRFIITLPLNASPTVPKENEQESPYERHSNSHNR